MLKKRVWSLHLALRLCYTAFFSWPCISKLNPGSNWTFSVDLLVWSWRFYCQAPACHASRETKHSPLSTSLYYHYQNETLRINLYFHSLPYGFPRGFKPSNSFIFTYQLWKNISWRHWIIQWAWFEPCRPSPQKQCHYFCTHFNYFLVFTFLHTSWISLIYWFQQQYSMRYSHASVEIWW